MIKIVMLDQGRADKTSLRLKLSPNYEYAFCNKGYNLIM